MKAISRSMGRDREGNGFWGCFLAEQDTFVDL